jgi:LysM repeat protein
MRRPLAILLVTLGLVAACGGSATPTPAPTGSPTPAPTDIFAETPAPTAEPSVASPTPIASASPVAGKRYVVKKGDTMWVIAQKNGITVAALKAANPKVNPNAMRVGTVLIIPPK